MNSLEEDVIQSLMQEENTYTTTSQLNNLPNPFFKWTIFRDIVKGVYDRRPASASYQAAEEQLSEEEDGRARVHRKGRPNVPLEHVNGGTDFHAMRAKKIPGYHDAAFVTPTLTKSDAQLVKQVMGHAAPHRNNAPFKGRPPPPSSQSNAPPPYRKRNRQDDEETGRRRGRSSSRNRDDDDSDEEVPKRSQKRVKFESEGSDAESEPRYGPCSECKGPHGWSHCPRNVESKTYRKGNEKYLGTGPRSNLKSRNDRISSANRTPMGKTRKSKPESDAESGDDTKTKNVNLVQAEGEPLRISVEGSIRTLPIREVMVDTGSDLTLINPEVLTKLGYDTSKLDPITDVAATTVAKQPYELLGSVKLPLTLHDRDNDDTYTVEVPFVVPRIMNCQALIGKDHMKKFFHAIYMDPYALEFNVNLKPDAPNYQRKVTEETSLYISKAVIIRPGDTQAIQVAYNKNLLANMKSPVLVEPLTLYNRKGQEVDIAMMPHLRSSESTNPSHSLEKYYIEITNRTNRIINLQANTAIGTVSLVEGDVLESIEAVKEKMQTLPEGGTKKYAEAVVNWVGTYPTDTTSH